MIQNIKNSINYVGKSQRQLNQFLFDDEFTTSQSAPISSPRTCEPGPGSLTVVDTASKYSISNNTLVATGTNTAANDPIFVSTTSYTRNVGKTFGLKMKCPISASSGIHGSAAWVDSAGTVAYFCGVNFRNGIIYPYHDTQEYYSQLPYVATSFYDIFLVQRSFGSYIIANGKLLGVFHNRSFDLYARLNFGGALRPLATYLKPLRVFQAENEWASNYGIATSYVQTPSTGTGISGNADGFTSIFWTSLTGQTLDLWFRRTDANNGWIYRLSQTGQTAKIIEVNGGVETERSSAAMTINNNQLNLVQVQHIGTEIRGLRSTTATSNPLVQANSYSGATFNQNATESYVSGFTVASNYATWPYNIPDGAYYELQKYMVA